MQAVNIKVRGRVQGVGFRYSTQQKAESFGITGWVRNMPNGNVEIMAEGEDSDLKKFVDWVRIGPSGARVIDVDVSYQFALGSYRKFSIEF
ncbi:acylphosphatase [Spirochaeta cellobiosiphila]|uniref:acylphosphatase n=1 Tax=Spirochaeta cellobiosiphila TaxID=504483 RepID=UPI00040F7665|nr:acylphosphatase [Spirochaeta cellobiosiphila]